MSQKSCSKRFNAASIAAQRAHTPQSFPLFDQCDPISADTNDLIPPPIDHNNLWKNVLLKRSVQPQEHGARSEGGSFGSLSSFQSEEDLDADAKPDYGLGNDSYNPATHGITHSMIFQQALTIKIVRNAPSSLTGSQFDDINIFDFIIRNKLSVQTYFDMQERFCPNNSRHTSLPSLKSLRTRILKLSGFKPMLYDRCKNSCMCFAGPFKDLSECLECNAPQSQGSSSRALFEYMPLIPQLRALFCNPKTRQTMEYRHNYKSDNSVIRDIFDGKQYHELRHSHVTIDGQRQPYKYFEDEREIALGLSTDGMCPFKRRKHSCWPLILVNYNLPPEIRTHINNTLCVGLIPGPKSPKNLGSFLIPLVEELVELAAGTPAVDYLKGVVFSLRAHILDGFGDIPALSKMLELVGHNGRFPCRLCLIEAIWGLTANGGTHLYCPLHHTGDPQVDPNPFHLPLQTHEEYMRKGEEVLKTPSDTARARLATKSGIKGISVLSRVPSVSIPGSFPIDIMHMVWINLIPQLAQLWTGNFNNLDPGWEHYDIHPTVWEALAISQLNLGVFGLH
ncbi:Transposase family Tnp2 protein [Ceratobasidium theobromae]|uniref:Transposase family Tnp2 protein n=1 Tax=Ceratobasidium theobromae TaxID=1582974 RepID=A0A5N5Q8Q3_9AGAM|nr:Transposase family Tnp2 protein [Ceratobasidium theobromae]